MSPDLALTQQLLWKLITAPEGAAAALAQQAPAERARAVALVRGDGRLSGIERIDVYADMYFYRIRDALQEDFVAVHALIGAARFHNLITDYLLAHPPSHFSLRYAGQYLPAFLRQHAMSMQWPYLADLAAMEWAILDAFDAPDAPTVAADDLSVVAPERWGELRFTATPSLYLLDLGWRVSDVWECAQREAPLPALEPATTAVRVWRQDLRVFHRVIDAAERAALSALRDGAPFATVCEAIAAHSPGADSAELAARLLATWLADGILSSLRTS